MEISSTVVLTNQTPVKLTDPNTFVVIGDESLVEAGAGISTNGIPGLLRFYQADGSDPGVAFGNRPMLVAQLPDAVNCYGFRSIVADATAPAFGDVVAGGGETVAPVYSDGINWRIG